MNLRNEDERYVEGPELRGLCRVFPQARFSLQLLWFLPLFCFQQVTVERPRGALQRQKFRKSLIY